MNISRDVLHVARDGGGGYLIGDETCALCGKRFTRTNLHVYKLNFGTRYRYFCSYACMREAERKKEREKQKKGAQKKTKEAAL